MRKAPRKPAARLGCWAALAACLSLPSAYALTPAEILILVNKDSPISSDVARMYQRHRGIPPENILRLSLGESPDRDVTRQLYRTGIVLPVKTYLTEHPAIRCLVTTSGFPYVIDNTTGKSDGAALDNELATVLREEPQDLSRWQPNPLYLRGQNPVASTDPRAFQMVYVMRLDGPDLKTITRMVEDAIATETAGLEGPVFGDAMGEDGNTNTGAADLSIRGAIDRLSGAGFSATLDLNPADWRQPAGGVGEQAAGAAFYIGWYSLQNFQDIFGKQGLARGSIAWHIASEEAGTLWNLSSKEWCINLMRRGAAVTLGPVFEPYLGAFPKADVLVEELLRGRTIAESYWLALPHVSWAMVILGDPLYRPFAAKARPALVTRAYVAENATRVLENGQTSPLLIQVQCVGPSGSGTPALTAVADAGMGLAKASGTVEIPALQAGQTAVVRVPSITAASDPTAMFRLHLDVRNEDGLTRRIVLEGRTGFSTISGGVDRQTLMFASPSGEFVVSGQPGNTFLTETATLQSKRITTPEGWAVTGTAFAPDGAHFVLTLLNPAKKQVMFAIIDSKSLKLQSAPGAQFLRWLSNRTLLLKGPAGLIEYDISLATSLPIFEPAGWTVNNIIPETGVQMLTAKDGRFAVKDGDGEIREILPGTGATFDRAVANDLSQFGGLDGQKRLWVQHGLQSTPEIIAQDVARVVWGPISRRVLVAGVEGSFRVYDGRDRSWMPLPALTAAHWSPDENRLLYIEAERQNSALVPRYLSLLTGRQTRQLCDVRRIGDIGAVAFSNGGETAFLLAGPDAGLQVWMMSLPPTAQPR